MRPLNTFKQNNMSIQHLDDLPAEQMLKVVSTLSSGTVSTKLDGANLWVGVDQQGVYVSREGKSKSAPKIYTPGQFEDVAPNDQFKAALQALQAVKTKLSDVLSPNEMIEVEVIFGSQPNVISYHGGDTDASIIFLRGVKGTDDKKVQQLSNSLSDTKITVSAEVKTSNNGIELQTEVRDVVFRFYSNKKYPISKVLELSNAQTEIDALQAACNSPSEVDGMTNGQLEVARENEQNKRQKINTVLILSKLKRALVMKLYGMIESKIDPGVDKEGFVLTVGDNLYKVVDKDTFVATNIFYQKGRKTAVSSILTTDPNADPLKRGGIVGMVKISLAKVMGKPELARAQSAKDSIKTLGLQDFLKQFEISDINATKNKMLAIIDNGTKLLNVHNKRFASNNGGELKVGDKSVKYTKSVVDRTKVAFAEAFNELQRIREEVVNSQNIEDLANAVFGRFVELNKNIKEELTKMISYMLLEDEAPVAAEPNSTTSQTSASDIAPKEAPVGGRYKFVMRTRNDSVLVAMKKKKIKGDKNV